MRDFETELRRQLRLFGAQDCRVLVGVSGGGDSMALLRGLWAVRSEFSLDLTVGHVDHALRSASADDAEWLAAQCADLGVPIEIRCAHVAEIAKRTRSGVEETARRVRYELLKDIAVDHGCLFLAVGHTADDQSETILHHLLRGTGLDGLRGMPAIRDLGSGILLIRPQLAVRRADLRTYLGEIGQEYREDVSNADPAFTRNRIRRTLLPLLRDEFNPRVEDALLRLGAQAAEWQDVIGQLARSLLDEVLLDVQPDHVRIDCGPLNTAQRPLVREALKLLWKRQAWPRGEMTWEHWDQLADLARDVAAGRAVQLPGGLDARRRGTMLVIAQPRANDR